MSCKSWEQVKRFHAMVSDISRDIPVWCEMPMDKEDWKRILLAGAFGQKVVPNPIGEGFLIVNNKRIRDSDKPDLSQIITQMMAFGNERGVRWTDPEWLAMMEEAA